MNITMPNVKLCKTGRKKRAWYDTILDGTGTAMGVLNSIDIETMRHRLSTTGEHIGEGFHIIAKWAPVVFDTQIRGLQLENAMVRHLGNVTVLAVNLTQDPGNWCVISDTYGWKDRGTS